MKLYYSPLSSNSRKVRIVSKLLDIDLDLININLAKREQRTSEFLGINPMGKVPVLEDGDFILSESAAIMIYLADSKPGNSLYPVDRLMRASINQWLFGLRTIGAPAIAAITYERIIKKIFNAGEPDPVQIKRQEDSLHAFAKVLDTQLSKEEWVVGPVLTIADIAIACSLMMAGPAQLPLQPYEHIQAWFERIQMLPAWKMTETGESFPIK